MSLEDELTNAYNNLGVLGVSALVCGGISIASQDDATPIVMALSFGGINGLYAGVQNVAADITSVPIKKRVKTLVQSFSHGILAVGANMYLPWAENDLLSAVSASSGFGMGLMAAGAGFVGATVYGERNGWFDEHSGGDDGDPPPPAPRLPVNDGGGRVDRDPLPRTYKSPELPMSRRALSYQNDI